LFLFTFFLQYFFAPYMAYNKYRLLAVEMKVNQTQFFEYTVPALFSLFFGVFLFNRDLPLKKIVNKIDPELALNLGYLLLFISISVQFALQIGFGVLSSIAYFTYYLRYVSAFCFLFSKSKIKYPIVIAIYLSLVFEALRGGVFIDFIVWSIYFFFVLALRFDFPLIARMGFILMGFLTLLIIQTVKSDYRKTLWSKTDVKAARGDADELDILTAEVGERSTEDIQTDGAIRTFRRLNQGWHLAKVLNTVPNRVPFANGEEMFSDVVSSIVPRIFYQNKKAIHTNEKFRKYTGHKLAKGTSMTIGILGDFYINFGRAGSFIMLFAFGGLVAVLFRFFIIKYVIDDPINFVWIPFMFTYLIRADNDFYSFSNGLLKGFLIFLFFNYVKKTLWPKYTTDSFNVSIRGKIPRL
ncbi:MAG: hypothetical protein ACKO96_24565, partial [Flammeovirgaceae bacterium]